VQSSEAFDYFRVPRFSRNHFRKGPKDFSFSARWLSLIRFTHIGGVAALDYRN